VSNHLTEKTEEKIVEKIPGRRLLGLRRVAPVRGGDCARSFSEALILRDGSPF
jgi:hypothetical protein